MRISSNAYVDFFLPSSSFLPHAFFQLNCAPAIELALDVLIRDLPSTSSGAELEALAEERLRPLLFFLAQNINVLAANLYQVPILIRFFFFWGNVVISFIGGLPSALKEYLCRAS